MRTINCNDLRLKIGEAYYRNVANNRYSEGKKSAYGDVIIRLSHVGSFTDCSDFRDEVKRMFIGESMLDDYSRGKAEGYEDVLNWIDESIEVIPVKWIRDIIADGEPEDSKAAWRIIKLWNKGCECS